MKKKDPQPKPQIELRNPHISQEAYCSNEKYQDHLFEQYKLYVEMADRLSERRMVANTFFLTLHTLIIGIAGFSYESLLSLPYKGFLIFPLLAIIALCYAWRRILYSYKQLNTGKFEVIKEYENLLPTRPYVEAEWKALGLGKDPKIYRPLTDIENWIPIIFAVLYIIGISLIIATVPPSCVSTTP